MNSDTHATSIERALSILEFLDGSRRGWNISELSRKLGMPKSSTHVIVVTLEKLGYLTREPGSRHYTLGLKVYGLGRGLMKNMALPQQALPHLKWLVENTRLTAHLGVLEKDQAMYIQKLDGPGLIQFDTYVGKRASLHCTAIGKALLAWAPPDTVQRVLSRRSLMRHTNKTISTAGLLRRELQAIRQRGYAVDDEEEEPEVRCIGAPIFSQSGELMGALSVSGTIRQIRDDNIAEIASFSVEAANRILGHRGGRPSLAEASA